MNIRTMAAVWAAKSAGFICRKMGRQGVTWAGKIALKINPHILEDLSSQIRKQNLRNLRNQWKNNNQQHALCGAWKGKARR